MSIPISQILRVSKYVLAKRFQSKKQYPLVLMLEPLFRCNLNCIGCGKVQYPSEVLRQNVPAAKCLEVANECDAPVVSIAGGEPLLHPEIVSIVQGLIQQKRFVYLCTNALLLEERIAEFSPCDYLSFSIHLDGPEEIHDHSVSRPGTYQKAISAIKAAVKAGFRVTTNTTLFNDAHVETTRTFFDFIMDMGVEGMMISPGYHYSKAKAQDSFLLRQQTVQLFRNILYKPKSTWVFNHSPLYLEFLAGQHDFECTPWGTATYNLQGWQGPCYLLEKSFHTTFQDMLEHTDWSKYGRKSGNPECADCMMHCGYEPTTVHYTFHKAGGFWKTVRSTLAGLRVPKPD